ncbi:hypothetical protein BCR37DRAFT_143436 [Protomyces lactucae-debilis]|uniref:Phosphatidylglycerol/phosphatidylinositol transfer protein n=1 Tax=Protomyces lactucae-debilis TaxID=2754530 RepID=A0A1Y2FUW9_PROLT|nr:uncharacterized protein BCR37DRAFT_143436 [Protomyces lactucae-debilis]ORY87084.1 hypothetical protein BCR37DRAFT_143436 [Protomyces lactucae-debilis]
MLLHTITSLLALPLMSASIAKASSAKPAKIARKIPIFDSTTKGKDYVQWVSEETRRHLNDTVVCGNIRHIALDFALIPVFDLSNGKPVVSHIDISASPQCKGPYHDVYVRSFAHTEDIVPKEGIISGFEFITYHAVNTAFWDEKTGLIEARVCSVTQVTVAVGSTLEPKTVVCTISPS